MSCVHCSCPSCRAARKSVRLTRVARGSESDPRGRDDAELRLKMLAAKQRAILARARENELLDRADERISALERYRADQGNPFRALGRRSGLSAEDLIAKATRRYVAGDIEVDVLEREVGRALGLR